MAESRAKACWMEPTPTNPDYTRYTSSTMHFIDWLILSVFLIIVVGAGLLCSRKSAESEKSYFLGSENKWWMLAASGAATNFSINGTVWNLAILMVLGMKSFWVTLVWWMPNAVFLMAFTGIWIRRCGGITSAEINKTRFGVGTGAKWARTSFAFMITLFSVASLCMSYIIIHKFAVVFGLSQGQAHGLALGVLSLTGVYVLFGGFKGVILSEFLQTVVLFAVAFIIGFLCYQQYTGPQLHAAITHGAGSTAVSPDYWKSLIPEATPRIGMFEDAAGYKDWKDFIGATLAFSVVGMIGCVGGAGGRYGEQRFLAATNTREAAKLAALWQFLGFPRWVMTGGLAFLGYSLYASQIGHDPESVLPEFLRSGLLAPGILGLVVAGLSGSFLTSFCSEINACASIIVRDLYQPLMSPGMKDSDRKLVRISYLVTALLTMLAVAIGYVMVQSQASGGGSALNVIWSWMLGGLLTCFVVPLAFRWYWGRMNGWGFAAGCLISLVPALAMLARAFTAEGSFLRTWPEAYYTYATLATSTISCVIVSLMTPPIEKETSAAFYAKVRPFGLWKSAAADAREMGLKMATSIPLHLIAINVVLGLIASYSLYMAPVYFLGHWPVEAWTCLIIFAVCCVGLYFTWYRTLPND
jgi:SSS family solute:Na+ symporter